MPITPKDRSALLRMAGNIAAGIVDPHGSRDDRGHLAIAHEAVSIALAIHEDPRLATESTPQGEAAARGRE
jgi:hypothetical protein